MEMTGVAADLYEAFGSVMMGLSKEHGMELDRKGRNDLRDWNKIRDFAHRFAELLRE